jgi:hypothetical protein
LRSCDDFGLTYKLDKYGHSITAYVPGPWVKELKSASDAVAARKDENALKEKHSQAALDNLKGKFGL